MPDFDYKAKTLQGATINGQLTAADQQDALKQLALQQLFPTSIEQTQEGKGGFSLGFGPRVGSSVLANFFTQLADLLGAGVPLLRSLQLLKDQTTNPLFKDVLNDVLDDVSQGQRLAPSMAKHPKVFNELIISMVQAGEEGSFVEDVLRRLAVFTQHQQEMKNRVTGAMVYPLFLLTFGLIVVTVMLIFFVPKFEPIFDQMSAKGQLPYATTLLLMLSNGLSQYGLFVLLGLGGAYYLVQNYLASADGRRRWDRFLISEIPLGNMRVGMGTIVRSLAISRFCRVLGTLLGNGVPLLKSLKISKDATVNVILSEAIDHASDKVSTGKSLAQPLKSSQQFPAEVIEMIAMGEEANQLERVLIDVSEQLERKTQQRLDVMLRLLEPFMLLLLAGAIMFIVVAILLPIMSSSSLA